MPHQHVHKNDGGFEILENNFTDNPNNVWHKLRKGIWECGQKLL